MPGADPVLGARPRRTTPPRRGPSSPGVDRGDLGRRPQVRTHGTRPPLERTGDRAHAAHRHVPVPGPATDHVVEEAPVGPAVGLVDRGERPDQRVGQDDAADQVGPERRVDHLPDRPLHQVAPVVRRRAAGGRRRSTSGVRSWSGTAVRPARRCGRRSRATVRRRPRLRPTRTSRRSPRRLRSPPAVHRRRRSACRTTPAVGAARGPGPARHGPAGAATRPGRSSATRSRPRRGTPARTAWRRPGGRRARAGAPTDRHGRGTRRRSGRCGRRRR